MRLLALLFSVLRVVQTQTQEYVSAYAGDSVTLASGAKNGLSLLRIEWSIYPNTTWIATLHDGNVNIQRFYRFKKRLHLNTESGDLTIYNLTLKDGMRYTVEVIYSNNDEQTKTINLEVKKRLQIPTIQKVAVSATQEGCFIALNCSSSDKDVNFSWHVSPPAMTSWSTKNGSSHIVVLTKSKQGLTFTCNSTKGEKSAHREFPVECDEKWSYLRNRCALISIGIILGAIALICCSKIMTSKWRCRQSLKSEATDSSF